jgi:hypothetical protein
MFEDSRRASYFIQRITLNTERGQQQFVQSTVEENILTNIFWNVQQTAAISVADGQMFRPTHTRWL